MKNIIRILSLVCLAGLSVMSCSEDSPYLFGAKEPYVKLSTLSENDGIFTPNAQENRVLLTSNAPWKVSSLADWLTCLTPEGEFDDTVKIQLPQNTGNTRKAQLVVYNTVGDQKTDTLVLTQQCAESFIPDGYAIKIQSDVMSKSISGDEYSELPFTITSSTEWRVFAKPTDNWCTVLTKDGTENGNGSVIISKNPSLKERSMYLYAQSVTYPSLKDSIKLTQSGHTFTLKVTAPRNKKVLLDEVSSTFTFGVETDGKWVVENVPSWLKLAKNEYEGNVTVAVTASAATSVRSAQLVIKSLVDSNVKDALTVDQRVIPDGQMKDSLALLAIYNATNGAKWIYPWKIGMPLNETNYPGVFFDRINGEQRVIDLSLLDFGLEGSLPNEIGWLSQLVKLKLQRNKLSGTLPASMNRLVNLTHLYISSNQFSGEFPDIHSLQSLRLIEADFNRFEGEFPASFSMLPKLSTLKFKYNHLDPNTCVPKKFGGWKLIYINPQRAVYGDASSDYKLQDCSN